MVTEPKKLSAFNTLLTQKLISIIKATAFFLLCTSTLRYERGAKLIFFCIMKLTRNLHNHRKKIWWYLAYYNAPKVPFPA